MKETCSSRSTATQVPKWKACLEIRNGPCGSHLWDFLDEFIPAWPIFSPIPNPLLINRKPRMNQLDPEAVPVEG